MSVTPDASPLFGTDGIRAAANDPCLQPECVRRIAVGASRWLRQRHPERASLHVVIGRDTRASGPAILMALTEGFAAESVRVFDADVVPTPAIARAVIDLDLPMGIAITASHNPAADNGIKFFGSGGRKLSPEDEAALEAAIHAAPAVSSDATPAVMRYDARRHYLESLANILPNSALTGLRIAVDCANGATFHTTPDLLRQLNAQVFDIGTHPDGTNINDAVGSEHTAALQNAVRETNAHLGIAHDGDGDRLILIDHLGQIVDGDAVLTIIGTHWAAHDRLANATVVATVMSNQGLAAALQNANCKLHRTPVGDRNVFFAMQDLAANLGGEASGHFIASDFLPTGDGLLAALLVLQVMLDSQSSLHDLAQRFQPFPQSLVNIPLLHKPPLDSIPALQADLQRIEAKAAQLNGRILVRYSGTEPKIRLLAESPSASDTQALLDALISTTKAHLPTRD